MMLEAVKNRSQFLVLLGCGALAAIFGCAQDESSSLNSALNDPFGGVNTKDEAVAFNDADISEISSSVQLFDDPTSKEVDVQAASQLADAQENSVNPTCNKVLMKFNWGQLDGNAAIQTITDWSGSLQTSSGVLILLDTIHFEKAGGSDVGDEILPRTDRQKIDFVSYTTIHQDGILAALVYGAGCGLANDNATTPVITFTTPKFTQQLPLAEVGNQFEQTYTVDALNNQVAVKFGQVKSCGGGMAEGGWQNGHFRGVLLGRDGLVSGYIKGIYGDHNGHHMVFAKIIDSDGHFLSRARGTYAPEGGEHGRFRLFTHDRNDQKIGLMRGRYVQPMHDAVAGLFIGHWKYFCAANDNDMEGSELDESIFSIGSEN